MPRIVHIIAPHYPHHITQRGKDYSKRLAVDVWAYCLMTNHVHILAVPAVDVSLSRCIGRTNLLYTQHVNRKYKRSSRLLPIPLISPLDSGGIRHPVPIQSAMVFRLNPPPLVGA